MRDVARDAGETVEDLGKKVNMTMTCGGDLFSLGLGRG